MKYILKTTDKNVALCDKDGNQISKWRLDDINSVGGLDKVIARFKKQYPNLVVDVQPADGVAPEPAPEPAPAPEPTAAE